ncbi:MAG: Lrp/AsnC family transcriptional regulator [Nocardioides sp.]|uniref:Lrp/AsnC family transcriptional regulator n=1 Tax=Nocardioides sp. TaxID=35761 RepID=UPI003D6C501C
MTDDTVLDELDQRIVAALQIDGRAPWRKIANVLGEPERSVARHGTELLARGAVQVVGLRHQNSAALLRLECSPGGSPVAAESLARRPDTTFCFLMTGSGDVVAEIAPLSGNLGPALITELPATPGLVRMVSYPILRYFRTIRGWRVGGLTAQEADAMATPLTADVMPPGVEELTPRDADIVDLLTEDGRAPLETIARRAGVSEATAARRVEVLLRNHQIHLRALVEPSDFGLPVQAMLWITAPPAHVGRIGEALADRSEVRYAAQAAGPHQIVAEITVPDTASVHRFVSDDTWTRGVTSVDIGLLLQARKRGGRILPF